MSPPNNLLLVFHSVRPDGHSSYGEQQNATPHIIDLAATDGCSSKVSSPCVWTPAIYSPISTDWYPSRSGVYTSTLSQLPETHLLEGLQRSNRIATGETKTKGQSTLALAEIGPVDAGA